MRLPVVVADTVVVVADVVVVVVDAMRFPEVGVDALAVAAVVVVMAACVVLTSKQSKL